MNSKNTFSDGHPVPFPSYRCRATAKEIREIKSSTYTHRCRDHADHGGQHSCICGRKWDREGIDHEAPL